MDKFNKPTQSGTTGGVNQGGAAPQQGNKDQWGGKIDQGKKPGMQKPGQTTGTNLNKNKDTDTRRDK